MPFCEHGVGAEPGGPQPLLHLIEEALRGFLPSLQHIIGQLSKIGTATRKQSRGVTVGFLDHVQDRHLRGFGHPKLGEQTFRRRRIR